MDNLSSVDLLAHLWTIIDQNCRILAKLNKEDSPVKQMGEYAENLYINKKVIEEYLEGYQKLPFYKAK